MKKCKCGKEIEDKWELCYKCADSQPDNRQISIERQVACKCVAQILTGKSVITEDDIRGGFNLFLNLIRNG